MKLFRKIKVTDRELSQVQDNVSLILQPLSKNAFIDGILISVTLVSGSNRVAHRLNRQPQGWVIVDTTSSETIYRTAWDSATIDLTASAAATFTLYIF